MHVVWPVVETKPFVSGWHLDCICDHLQAQWQGDIRNLLINVPPRHTKSLTCAVLFPAWTWLQDPSFQWLWNTYAQNLSTRDSVKCRRLIQSRVYRTLLDRAVERWGYNDAGFRITTDQNTKTRFENDKGGYRLASSVGGTNTGEGGDAIGVDDPHNVLRVESRTDREAITTWWDDVMSTRLNDPRTGFRTVIMQRSHAQDLSGYLLKKHEAGIEEWAHLKLPAHYTGSNCIMTGIGWEDPRNKVGEPLHPERIGHAELDRIAASLTPYGTAAQLEQEPVPKEGSMFDRVNFKIVEGFDHSLIDATVRYWDKAASETKGSAYSAGVRMHRLRGHRGLPTFIIDSVIRGRWSFKEREDVIKATAKSDAQEFGRLDVNTYIEQEPGSGGKESAQSTIANLAGYIIEADRPIGDKATRARPLAVQVQGHNVSLLEAAWNMAFLDEITLFPKSDFKDQTDAASGGFAKINPATEDAEEIGTW